MMEYLRCSAAKVDDYCIYDWGYGLCDDNLMTLFKTKGTLSIGNTISLNSEMRNALKFQRYS